MTKKSDLKERLKLAAFRSGNIRCFSQCGCSRTGGRQVMRLQEAADSTIWFQVAAKGREPCVMNPGRSAGGSSVPVGHDVRLGSPRTTAARLVCELWGLSAPGAQRQRSCSSQPPSSRHAHLHGACAAGHCAAGPIFARRSHREGWVNPGHLLTSCAHIEKRHLKVYFKNQKCYRDK